MSADTVHLKISVRRLSVETENDYDDFRELEALSDELKERHIRLRDVSIKLAEAQSAVLKLKANLDIIKDAKKDTEEMIRIKKLKINNSPK